MFYNIDPAKFCTQHKEPRPRLTAWLFAFDGDVMAKSQRRYTDEQRASFVVMLEAAGYPDTPGALKRVAANAGVHENVLRRWYKGTSNPAPTTIVSRKKIDLKKAIDDELSAIFKEMHVKREDADYRALGTVAGILMDKKLLLEGKPTERIAVDDWHSQAIEDIKAGRITYPALAEAFDDDLATQLFREAGITVSSG